MEFERSVHTHFDFLVRDFGFALTSSGEDAVRYDATTLYVAIGSGKGEIDLHFGVKIDTDTIRPYVSHLFSIAEVVRYYKTGPFPVLSTVPAMPGTSDEQRHVIHLAALTKKYCGEILRGDLTALERLSLNRGARHS